MRPQNRRKQCVSLARTVKNILAKFNILVDIDSIKPFKYGYTLKVLPISLFDASKCQNILYQQLRFPLIEVRQTRRLISIIISLNDSIDNRLMPVLKHPDFMENTQNIRLPYVVGFDCYGEPIIVDFANILTLIVGGTSNSGKSVALICLLISIMWCCTPDEVELAICDCGSASLVDFKNNCTFIDDPNAILEKILWLKNLIVNRIELSKTNPDEFRKQKFLIVVFDEYADIVYRIGDKLKLLTTTVKNILQNCRQAKVCIIISSQNPTKENLGGVDKKSVWAGMAFQCSNDCSRTILGESGAEDLEKQGEMLFKSRELMGTQKLMGSFVEKSDNRNEIPEILDTICAKHGNANYSLTMDESLLLPANTESSPEIVFSTTTVVDQKEVDDKLFADIIMWTLGHGMSSGNAIDKEFGVGEKGGRKLIDKLYKFKIVGSPNSTKPRIVLPNKIEDLTDNAIAFLEHHSYTRDHIIATFENRN